MANKEWEHMRGEPCPTQRLLVSFFGEEEGMRLLFEETCFPMSDEVAFDQAQYLCDLARHGELPVLDGYSPNWRWHRLYRE